MARFALALLPLALAFLPLSVAAQNTAPVALPQTNVMHGPMTFSASPNGSQIALPYAERRRALQAIREQRYAQERAFVQRYGHGVPVRLRARRY